MGQEETHTVHGELTTDNYHNKLEICNVLYAASLVQTLNWLSQEDLVK